MLWALYIVPPTFSEYSQLCISMFKIRNSCFDRFGFVFFIWLRISNRMLRSTRLYDINTFIQFKLELIFYRVVVIFYRLYVCITTHCEYKSKLNTSWVKNQKWRNVLQNSFQTWTILNVFFFFFQIPNNNIVCIHCVRWCCYSLIFWWKRPIIVVTI